ncbi:MAG: PQQ-dependent sugar dehydrogenase, partial [Gammaproteobacteria bacterium]
MKPINAFSLPTANTLRLILKMALAALIVAGLTASVVAFAGWQAPAARPQPAGGEITLDLVNWASGLDEPVGIASAGDERLFVIERAGIIKIIQPDGTVLPTPFLNITDRVDSSQSEEGLLGIVFHPDYAGNGFFYVNYTNTTGQRRTRISRFEVTGDPNVADPNSELILLTVDQPEWNHNAGHIMFGPDGYLYIPLGDGGGAGDPESTGQDPGDLLGSLLRIDPDVAPEAEDAGQT